MYKLGVIPAAGKAERWGGLLKELLPIKPYTCLIDLTIQAMRRGGCDAVLVVASVEKLPELMQRLEIYRVDCPMFYVVQYGDDDIWSAIRESFAIPADRYLFAMPDTVYPEDAFVGVKDAPFSLGIHQTDKPERFGMLRDGQVVNKQPGKPGPAWGLLRWSNAAVELWQREHVTDYTDGINQAIRQFGLHTWDIEHYHDMASFEDYRDWLCR